MAKITVEVSSRTAEEIREFVKVLRENGVTFPNSNSITQQELIQVVLDSLALAWTRPGSWEGSAMLDLLNKHGLGW